MRYTHTTDETDLIARIQELAAQRPAYNLNAVVSRCGAQIQARFGITPAEFQSARRALRKNRTLLNILRTIYASRPQPEQDAPPADFVDPREDAQRVTKREILQLLAQVQGKIADLVI